ncbi:hypothetical protein B296_00051710 [Ensete ventricosum]|uniref:Uncharacterized protein n=1 Tax=Ensete ventricosum TaxID=4639 RepID=A0A426YFF2_ENSVE|nr:hypothetical protein B296_00051710 [Ensete ventricosum]
MDNTGTLEEGDKYGQLEHNIWQFEVAVRTEVADHARKQRIGRWRRTPMVEGACSRVEGVTLVLGDSPVVSTTKSGAVGGVVFLALCDLADVLGLLFGATEGVKRLQ